MENKERFTDGRNESNLPGADKENVQHNMDENLEQRDQPIDLDGDGMIGNTGGFYGGTSYVGSNYGADWNSEDNSKHAGNYGAAGQKDDTDLTDDANKDDDRLRNDA